MQDEFKNVTTFNILKNFFSLFQSNQKLLKIYQDLTTLMLCFRINFLRQLQVLDVTLKHLSWIGCKLQCHNPFDIVCIFKIVYMNRLRIENKYKLQQDGQTSRMDEEILSKSCSQPLTIKALLTTFFNVAQKKFVLTALSDVSEFLYQRDTTIFVK